MNQSASNRKPEKHFRLPQVEELTGKKKSSIYAGVRDGSFPAPVRLSARSVAWRESDLAMWQAKLQQTGGQS